MTFQLMNCIRCGETMPDNKWTRETGVCADCWDPKFDEDQDLDEQIEELED